MTRAVPTASRAAPIAGLLALLGAAGSALPSCSDQDFVVHVETVVERFEQDPARYSDILLIIDDSRSMVDEQERVAANFDAFVQWMDVVETSYHIGVTTTDLIWGSGLLRGDPPYLTPNTPDLAERFRERVLVGAGGSGNERGLDAAWVALNSVNLAGANAGFLREDANLVFVFVSDEDDHSFTAPDEFVEHFEEIKEPDKLLAAGLIGLDPTTGLPGYCGDVDDEGGGAEPGERYWEVIQHWGGAAGSVCADSFERILQRIGQLAAGLEDRFPLAEEPNPGSVHVVLLIPGTPQFISGGLEVPPEGVEGQFPWQLEQDQDERWWVRFTDPDSVPPPNSQIAINYER